MLGTLSTAAGGSTSLQGGQGGAAGPATSTTNSGFDTSGWNVTFGSGSISTDAGGVLKWAAAAAVIGGLLWYLSSRRK